MYSIRLIPRCTLCIKLCFSYDLPFAFYQNYPQTFITLGCGVMSHGDWCQALLRQRNGLASNVFFVDISTLEYETTASSRNTWHKLPSNTVPHQRRMKTSKPTGVCWICSKYETCSDSLEDVQSWLFELHYARVGIVHTERRQPWWLWVRRLKEQLRSLVIMLFTWVWYTSFRGLVRCWKVCGGFTHGSYFAALNCIKDAFFLIAVNPPYTVVIDWWSVVKYSRPMCFTTL